MTGNEFNAAADQKAAASTIREVLNSDIQKNASRALLDEVNKEYKSLSFSGFLDYGKDVDSALKALGLSADLKIADGDMAKVEAPQINQTAKTVGELVGKVLTSDRTADQKALTNDMVTIDSWAKSDPGVLSSLNGQFESMQDHIDLFESSENTVPVDGGFYQDAGPATTHLALMANSKSESLLAFTGFSSNGQYSEPSVVENRMNHPMQSPTPGQPNM